ncbi:SDR family NAD(P)-dependent oxidoreductase [Paracoccus sp. (in: a-proteobacteria)]|uniref:SDR family NAD(P)-dependent oxidoreductase n=1 Tax=Paracoccus sp. TaxID=267 RepID=UPI002AFF1106|nr:SDR family NAD(P)-dependent oxidoreductase [Paracoccus sp. (in: a-proteobacteria)]
MSGVNSMGLEGGVCAITGAGSGIGRGIALAFARDGARVAILDRDLAGAEETLAQVRSAGAEGVALEVDTSDLASVEAAHARIAQALGAPDVLVNNAGIMGQGGALLDLPLEGWQRLLDVNLTGYFICSQVFGRGMVERGSGAMVHVVSITALEPLPFTGNYGVAKAGAAMLSHLLAAELGPRGVRSNAVHPGLVQTTMTEASYRNPEVAQGRARLVPEGRVAQPEDIADAVLFLASPRAAYVNGADLLVDGGLAQNLMAMVPRGR